MRPVDIATVLWQDDCLHELHVRDDGRPVQIWIPCSSYRAFARMLGAEDCYFSAIPRTDRQTWATGRAPALWAVLQTGTATAALQRFRPAPTFVARAGRTQQRIAFWALSAPLWGSYIEQATERLAYALHALRRAAKLETLLPSPYAKIDGRQHYIEFFEPEIYSARQVVGHLRDAPPADGWRRAA